MPVRKDESGRRWVEVEVEVPGTPEEVWRAIATGPGISSWFVPTVFEEEDGQPVRTRCDFGPGMESVADVTEWEPPHRFVAESADLGEGAPTVASEWIVEARDGGTCVVRVVHSLFATSDDWDDELGAWEGGWPTFFRILRLYLQHFGHAPGASFQVVGASSGSPQEAWQALTTGLGIGGATRGDVVRNDAQAPELSAIAEHVGPEEHPELLLRLDAPAPGLVHMFALPLGGQVVLPLRFYLYGEGASDAVAEMEPAWQEWLGERFPSPGS